MVIRAAKNPELSKGGNAYAVWYDKAGKAGVTIKNNTIVTVPGAKGTKAFAATTDGKGDASETIAGENAVIAVTKKNEVVAAKE